MKILFVSGNIPYKANSGITVKIFNLLAALSQFNDVVAAFISDKTEMNVSAEKRCTLNVRNHLILEKKYSNRVVRYCSHVLRVLFMTRVAKSRLATLIRKENPDIVWLEFGYICHLIPFLRQFRTPIVYGSHNSQFLLDYGVWKTHPFMRKLLQAPFIFVYFIHERLFFRLADRFCCISSHDMAYYGRFIPPKNIAYLPYYFDDRNISEKEHGIKVDHKYICLVGSLRAYQNYSAVIFTLQLIWPLVHASRKDLYLYIIGELPPGESPEYRELQNTLVVSNNVIVTGEVPSVIPYVKSALVNIVPILLGSGVRTKIIESVACRTPVVSTGIGAEGLPFVNDESILIADDPAQFSKKVLQLVDDEAGREKISSRAYAVYSKELSIHAAVENLKTILSDYDKDGSLTETFPVGRVGNG